MNVFEIGMDLGPSHSKNISRQFKQLKGYAPSVYRKKTYPKMTVCYLQKHLLDLISGTLKIAIEKNSTP